VAVLALVFQEAGGLSHSPPAEGGPPLRRFPDLRALQLGARAPLLAPDHPAGPRGIFLSVRKAALRHRPAGKDGGARGAGGGGAHEPVKRGCRVIRRLRRSRSCWVMSPMTSTRPCEPRSWVW